MASALMNLPGDMLRYIDGFVPWTESLTLTCKTAHNSLNAADLHRDILLELMSEKASGYYPELRGRVRQILDAAGIGEDVLPEQASGTLRTVLQQLYVQLPQGRQRLCHRFALYSLEQCVFLYAEQWVDKRLMELIPKLMKRQTHFHDVSALQKIKWSAVPRRQIDALIKHRFRDPLPAGKECCKASYEFAYQLLLPFASAKCIQQEGDDYIRTHLHLLDPPTAAVRLKTNDIEECRKKREFLLNTISRPWPAGMLLKEYLEEYDLGTFSVDFDGEKILDFQFEWAMAILDSSQLCSIQDLIRALHSLTRNPSLPDVIDRIATLFCERRFLACPSVTRRTLKGVLKKLDIEEDLIRDLEPLAKPYGPTAMMQRVEVELGPPETLYRLIQRGEKSHFVPVSPKNDKSDDNELD